MNPLAGLQSEKPAEPVVIGAPVALTYRATLALPEGYSAALPKVSKLETKFADYQSSYSMEQGVLTVQRVLLRKKLKLEVSEWDEYLKFIKAIVADEAQLFPLTRAGGPLSAAPHSQEAAELVEKAIRSIENREFDAALESLARAERLNSLQVRLWWTYGFLYGTQNQNAKAIEALQKEVEYHPENLGVYRPLASVQKRAGRKEDVIQTLRLWVKAAPGNAEAALTFTDELLAVKRYGEAIEPLEAAYKSNPDNVRIEVNLLAAFLLGGRKAAGSDLLAKLRERKLDPGAQNDVAYTLLETGVDLALALKLAQTAVSEMEEQLKQVALSTVSDPDLRRVVSLGGAWDTLGWAYFHAGDLTQAEKFLNAAWVLRQCAECADHLGQLYERQKSQSQAVHMYRLALAAQRDRQDTRDRLARLGATESVAQPPGRVRIISAEEELSQMRSAPVPSISQRGGSAEFFVLLSPTGVLETRFVSGDENLKPAAAALSKIPHKISFPDNGPERIPRRGILSCSQFTTPACNFVLLPPASTRP